MKIENIPFEHKIFFLGMNKTATTSFHEFFLKNGFKSTHSPKWWYFNNREQFSEHQVYTDGYEYLCRKNHSNRKFVHFPDIDFLTSEFPNSYYFLQTRPMKDWLLSRQLKYFYGSTKSIYDHDEETIYRNLKSDYSIRNFWHSRIKWKFDTIVNEKKPKLCILDITQKNDVIVEKIENYLKYDFEHKILLEDNKTIKLYNTWINDESINFFSNKIDNFLKNKLDEI